MGLGVFVRLASEITQKMVVKNAYFHYIFMREYKIKMNDLYKNKKGEIEYNKVCQKCIHTCKQGCNVIIVTCPKYKEKC